MCGLMKEHEILLTFGLHLDVVIKAIERSNAMAGTSTNEMRRLVLVEISSRDGQMVIGMCTNSSFV